MKKETFGTTVLGIVSVLSIGTLAFEIRQLKKMNKKLQEQMKDQEASIKMVDEYQRIMDIRLEETKEAQKELQDRKEEFFKSHNERMEQLNVSLEKLEKDNKTNQAEQAEIEKVKEEQDRISKELDTLLEELKED